MARSTGSRVYLSLIGLLLFVAGGLFTWLMGRSFQRAREMESWPRTEAVILKAEVEERRIDPNRPTELRFAGLYSYEWEGVDYRSSRFALRGTPWTSKPEKVRESLERYPVGSVHEVAVNPSEPAMALLDLDSRAPGYSIWFPAIIALGGLGTMAGAWRSG